MNTQKITDIATDIFAKALKIKEGHLANYIPELAKINPDLFAIAITDINGHQICLGDIQHEFTLQSTSKPFVYGLALETLGEKEILNHVGVEPTGEAFDSIIELEKHTHRPYNPMINAGAIAISNLVSHHFQERRNEELQLFLNNFANRQIQINWDVFNSEKLTAHRNRAIAHLLKNFNVIPFDIEQGLDLYFGQCSMAVNVKDLSLMAATLANGGINPTSKIKLMQTQHTEKTLALMLTCGMYDTAGEWAYNVGVPAKSGVSGAIFAVIPGQMGISAFSPLITKNGHSLRAYYFIENLVQTLKFSIFNSGEFG